MANDRWREDVLEAANHFAEQGQELMNFADGLREAAAECDQDTCLALVAAFLERLMTGRVRDAQRSRDS